jgi:ABC-type antimicrobial peptide transport system permease subunit
VALILSLIGVYGVWTLFVSHHQREFGIRLSLGAEPREVRKEVLRKNLKLTFIGLCAGIVLALSMTRLIRHWLFKVQGDDPGTFLAIVLLVTAASLVAGLAPAWRASQVDVMRILRE